MRRLYGIRMKTTGIEYGEYLLVICARSRKEAKDIAHAWGKGNWKIAAEDKRYPSIKLLKINWRKSKLLMRGGAFE